MLSNIYLHVLDVMWTHHSAPYGELVRYCDDFVVMCRTAKDCEQAEARIRVILQRLGLELHRIKRDESSSTMAKRALTFSAVTCTSA